MQYGNGMQLLKPPCWDHLTNLCSFLCLSVYVSCQEPRPRGLLSFVTPWVFFTCTVFLFLLHWLSQQSRLKKEISPVHALKHLLGHKLYFYCILHRMLLKLCSMIGTFFRWFSCNSYYLTNYNDTEENNNAKCIASTLTTHIFSFFSARCTTYTVVLRTDLLHYQLTLKFNHPQTVSFCLSPCT